MNTHFIPSSDIIDTPVMPEGDVLVFKTGIRFRKDVKKLAQLLNQTVGRKSWTVDLTDVDKVLRIETAALQAQDIISIINRAGYFCQELPD